MSLKKGTFNRTRSSARTHDENVSSNFMNDRKYILAFLILLPVCSLAQMVNLNNNLYWDAYGSQAKQAFGYGGLDYLGRINDSIPHALSIGSDGGASYVFNQIPLDTLRRFKFPGQEVHRCNLNKDPYPDFVCWSSANRNITFLFGTEKPDSFRVARVLPGNLGHDEFDIVSIVTADFENSGHDDVIISDYVYGDIHGRQMGRLLFFRGGDTIRAYANDSLYGTVGHPIGAQLQVGRIHNKTEQFLVEERGLGTLDTDNIALYFYPLQSPFHFEISDSLILHSNTAATSDGGYTNGFIVCDVNDDSTEDLIFGHAERVVWYKGGATISPYPSGYFSKPKLTGSATYGSKLVDVHDVTGRGYPSLLITDPEGDLAGGMQGGTVFLFNMGKALKDSCVAYASRQDFESYFGTQAIAVNDVSGDGLADFLVGGLSDHLAGYVAMFKGSPNYGPLSVQQTITPPTGFLLEQNYPNPVVDDTRITFAIPDNQLDGSEVTVKLYDVLGKFITTVYRGVVDGFGYTLRFGASNLPSGNYTYRLSCAGKQLVRKMNVVH